jgi:glucose/arabinose dehydrogenase
MLPECGLVIVRGRVHTPFMRFTQFFRAVLSLWFAIQCLPFALGQPFTVQGPGVNPSDFRVTTFASGLSFPMGMAQLSDGSLLVTVVQNNSFFGGTNPGRILRLTDTNNNGFADDAGTILFSNLPPALTALRVTGNLVFVTGPGRPIQILRMEATPAAPLTLVGRLVLTYPSGWTQHQHSELGVRKTPGFTNRYDLFFQIGAQSNFAATTNTVALTNDSIPGAFGSLVGDAIHRITIIDDGATLTATNLTQIAAGTRNAAGFTFHPVTGDFYFEDNGIDGLVNGNEPHSADELNIISRTNLGGVVEYFGFPSNYISYRTNSFIGGAGIPPLVAFQPLPDPFTGRESEGANKIAFAPPGFPDGLNAGVFLGFHGKFSDAGVANEENPVVYADPATGSYFHFILGQQVGIGHLDGLLATRDSLFVAELVATGSLSSGAGAGVIYQIKSLVTPALPTLTIERLNAQLQLIWTRGVLQEATEISGPWAEVAEAFSPLLIQPSAVRKFYRTMY